MPNTTFVSAILVSSSFISALSYPILSVSIVGVSFNCFCFSLSCYSNAANESSGALAGVVFLLPVDLELVWVLDPLSDFTKPAFRLWAICSYFL